MCGIAGVLRLDGGRVAPEELAPMLERIAHRGPDGRGTWCEGPVGLGHTRLAIIDLVSGEQPMGNEDGRVQVVFNGEIYNHRALRAELEGRHTFTTHSDTEVLVHLYEELGEGLVDRLEGFFAFALWDAREERLVLARDRLGKKPLFVGRGADRVVFASELRALLAAWKEPRELDPRALDDVLAVRYVQGARSGLAGIERLLPGEVRVLERGDSRSRRYWTPPAPAPDAAMDFEAATAGFRERFDRAVASRLEADVPVGLLLSGGIDSTAVLESMARVAPFPVRTFTLAFTREKESEAAAAKRAAEHFGTEHHEFQLTEADLVGHVDELLPRVDEPFADPSMLPTALICRLARQEVTVCLGGDGGDELFGGYSRYTETLAADEDRPDGWQRRLYEELLPHLPQYALKGWKLARSLRHRLATPEGRYVQSLVTLDPLSRAALRGPRAREAREPQELEQHLIAELEGPGALAGRMMALDLAHYLPGLILRKVDLASMLESLEMRSPFLDRRLVEWAATVPIEHKLVGGDRKRLVRRALEGRVPPELLERGKYGFGTPLGRWFRRELRGYLEEHLLASALVEDGWLDGDAVARLVAAHRRKQRNLGEALWALLATEVWYRTWVKSA